MTRCEVNQIFRGKVAAVQNYGAFVEIPGCKQQGLVHKSQVSSSWVDDVAEVLQRGEHVWCKIISVGNDGKIGLSMKLVNQGDGTDLDPTGIERQKNEQKRQTVGPPQKKIIELQAVLNRTCKKCGLQGHFEHDCFGTRDGKKYELLPDMEDDQPPPGVPESTDLSQSEKSARDDKTVKKKLKKKKSKKSKQKSVSSSSEASSDDGKKRKKNKKKHSKSKKRKRRNSESSSDDSEDNVKEKHSKKCKHSRSRHDD